MQTGPAIVEISKEIFKKIENRMTTAQLYYSWAHTQGTLYPATELWNTCIFRFTVALFAITRTWNQLRCPSSDEWMIKSWYMYTMKFYSTIKNNGLMTFTGK